MTRIRTYLLRILLLSLALLATPLRADEGLNGVWLLESYRWPDREAAVSGQLQIQYGYFSMTYGMQAPGGEPSMRSHTGRYSIADGRITFHVDWWVELVEGVARIVPPMDEGAGLRRDGDTLYLSFGSGGVQTLQRAPALNTH